MAISDIAMRLFHLVGIAFVVPLAWTSFVCHFSPLGLLLNNIRILIATIYGSRIDEDRGFAAGEAALPLR
jgi:hypothetical protein